ncbi:MAG TPA: GNAT family N-acyltransferase [Candidatus Hydrogenedentes bacterium]|nr:GNAT family N-acyltransferase [Candidatus Hydrogenedentota bacterium]
MSDIVVDMVHGTSPEAERLEYEIYVAEGYIAPNHRRKVLENEHYPEFIHFVARDRDQVVGSLRLVTDPRPRFGVFRLAAFTHFTLDPWVEPLLCQVGLKHVVEVGTMVIRPEYRGSETYLKLFEKAFEYGLMTRIHAGLATIDAGFCDRLERRGVPLVDLGPSRFYMGSETQPVLIDMPRLVSRVLGEAVLPPLPLPEVVERALA